MNNDGYLDFVTANLGDSTYRTRLGNGAGSFSASSQFDGSTGSRGRLPHAVALGDFNGNGAAEIFSAIPLGNVVEVFYLNSGEASGVLVGAEPLAVELSDFIGDGKPDFASANRTGNSDSIRLGTGTGGIKLNSNGTPEISVAGDPVALATGDFNEDGRLDFVTANESGNALAIGLNNSASAPVAGRLNALSLPGANAARVEVVKAPPNQTYSALTVEAWVKPGSVIGRYDILNSAPLFFNLQDGKPAAFLNRHHQRLWLFGCRHEDSCRRLAACSGDVERHAGAVLHQRRGARNAGCDRDSFQ